MANGDGEFIPWGATIYLSTGTADKVYDLQMAQAALKAKSPQKPKRPLTFKPFSALAELCKSPTEDGGNYEANAYKKSLATIYAFQRLIENVHNTEDYKRFYTDKLAMNVNKPVYLANEDAGYGLKLPKEFFTFFDETGIQAHMKKLRDALKPGECLEEFRFPGVETGPLLRDCGGEEEFARRVKEALDKVVRFRKYGDPDYSDPECVWKKAIPIKCHSTLIVREVKPDFSDKRKGEGKNGHSATEAREITLRGEINGVFIFSPVPLGRCYSSDHFIFSDNFQKSFAELDSGNFAYTALMSARAQVIDKLQKYVKSNGKHAPEEK